MTQDERALILIVVFVAALLATAVFASLWVRVVVALLLLLIGLMLIV